MEQKYFQCGVKNLISWQCKSEGNKMSKTDNKIISYYKGRAEYRNEDIKNKYKDFYRKHSELMEVTEEVDGKVYETPELERRFFSVLMNEVYRKQYGGVLINSLDDLSTDILEVIYFLTLAREYDFKVYLVDKDIELVSFLENIKDEIKNILEKELSQSESFNQKETGQDLGLKL